MTDKDLDDMLGSKFSPEEVQAAKERLQGIKDHIDTLEANGLVIEKDEPDPVTIRAVYFLARTEMKLGRFEEAETLYIRIYSMSKAFYDEWGCDYLLGVCRQARGKT